MTTNDEELAIEDKVIVAFDICSSSNIIEDLSLTHNLIEMRYLLIEIKKFLKRKSEKLNFILYKFTGDGWILLFPKDIRGIDLLNFLTEFSLFFKQKLTRSIIPILEVPIEIKGLTFGIEKGPLIKIVMMGNNEYIGRALNIACRLQCAIKDKDKHPEYKVLVSKQIFKHYLKGLKGMDGYAPKRAKRTLRNIRGGNEYQCIKLHLPVNDL